MTDTTAIRTLVAEKNQAARQIITKILGDNGYEKVAFTASGDQVLEALKKEAADIYIIDWSMAGANNMELLETCMEKRKLFRQPKMLMGSGVSPTSLEEAFKLGVRSYINKPFTPYLFMVKMEKILFGGYHDKPLRDIERKKPQSEPQARPELAEQPPEQQEETGPSCTAPEPEPNEKPSAAVLAQHAKALLHFEKASELLTLRKFDKAIAEFARAIKLKMLFPEAYKGIAEAFRGQGNLERTSQFMNKAAETHAWLGQHDCAREVYEYVRKASPAAPNPYKVMGDHLRQQKNPHELVETYRRAAELSPGDVSVAVALSRALVDTGAKEEAAEVLRPIVDREDVPEDVKGLFVHIRPPEVKLSRQRTGPGMEFLDVVGAGDGTEKRRAERIALADYAAKMGRSEDSFQIVDISLIGIGFKPTTETFEVGQELIFDLVSMGETKVRKVKAVVKRITPRVVGCEFSNDVKSTQAKLASKLPAFRNRVQRQTE